MKPLPLLLIFTYALSGFAGLAYEILWARQLGLVFGASNFGIVITIAAFMAGLGGGSLLASRFAFILSRPLLLFAVLECLLGLYAFNLPQILAHADGGVTEVSAGAEVQTWFVLQGLVLFVLFSLPAMVMGLGFPLILSVCRQLNISLATAYGLNTLGGVLGCLFPLLALPVFGWTVSVRLVALLSFLIAIICLGMHFRVHGKLAQGSRPTMPPLVQLLLYAVVGAMALVMQIAWSRLYGMLLLRTEYVVALLVACFLIGIALGSLVSHWMRSSRWQAIMPLLVAVGVMLSLATLPWVARWAEGAHYASLMDAASNQGLLLFALTLPATLAFGAWLPILARISGDEHSNGAMFYAANSLGAALGALIAGFVLMPLMGTPASLVLAMIVVLVVALHWIKLRWYRMTVPALSVAALWFASWPPVSVLLPQAQAKSHDLSLFENALAVTHVIQNEQGHRFLLSDLQRMDASSEPTAITVQRIQGMLPMLLGEKGGSVLFLGLGTGITAAGALPFDTSQITAVELSQGAINAAGREFALSNDGVTGKITVVNDDARRFIKASSAQYDVIVGDLFHPDLVGRGALLSLQQFQRVKARLSDSGIFVQWVALNQFDVKSLKVILETFRQAFPRSQLFVDGFRLALVGSVAGVRAQSVLDKGLVEDERRFAGEDAWSWLGRYWGEIPKFSGPVQDEWAPVIEYSIPEARFNRGIDLSATLRFLLQIRPEAGEAAPELHLTAPADIDRFDRAYEATNLIYASWLAKLSGQEEEALSFLEQAYAANPMDRWVGFEMADRMFASLNQAAEQGLSKQEALLRILEMRPDHVDALKLLWRLEMAAGEFDSADDIRARLLRLNPYDAELEGD